MGNRKPAQDGRVCCSIWPSRVTAPSFRNLGATRTEEM